MPVDNKPHVQFIRDGRLLEAILDQPNRRNALSDRMLSELVNGIQEHLDDGVRAVVIRGQTGTFCSGRDLMEETRTEELGPDELTVKYRRFADMMERFSSLPLVKIAIIDGFAVGAGWVLASHCDLRYAGPDTRFSIPELNLGFPFGMNGIAGLARHVGLTRAAELVLSGRRFGATEALGYGFLSNSLPLEDFESEARAMAQLVASRPSLVLRQTIKELQDAARSLVHVDGRNVESMVIAAFDDECRQANTTYSSRYTQRKAS